MFRIEVQKPESLVVIRYSGHVSPAEVMSGLEVLRVQTEELAPGFRCFTDLSAMESTDAGCAPHIGAIMDFLRDKGLDRVVRLIPDARKDIGLNILSLIHYGGSDIRTETYESLAEAMQSLNDRAS